MLSSVKLLKQKIAVKAGSVYRLLKDLWSFTAAVSRRKARGRTSGRRLSYACPRASSRLWVYPDLVLCDIGLSGMDGYEVACAFRSDDALREMRLIALSSYTLPEDLQRAAEVGFEEHLAKPPSIERIDAVLGRS